MNVSTQAEAAAAEAQARAEFRRMLLGWVQDAAALKHARLDTPCRRDETPALDRRRAA